MPELELIVVRGELLGRKPETLLQVLHLSGMLAAQFGTRILRVLGKLLLDILQCTMVVVHQLNKILDDLLFVEKFGIKLLKGL